MSSHFILRMWVVALVVLAWPAAVLAQAYPDRPVKMIVNFAPGGAADVLARALAPGLSEALKQPVIVENKPGANGNIGVGEAVRAPNNGYTLLLSSGSAVTINPLIYSNLGFNPENDLVPVAAVSRILVYLETHPSLPVNNVQEFIAYAKANPGKLSFGSPGAGSSPHLAAELFKRQAGIDAVHVPYKGAGPALIDVLGGQLQFWFDPGLGLKYVKEGRLKVLAIGSPKRNPELPDVPTLAESGLPGFDADTVFGVYVPVGTPAAIVDRLHNEINKVLQQPAMADVIKGLGAGPAVMSREGFIQLQHNERERLGALVKEIGLKLD
jgi:tripartite-type tricarboxylate transporter receptor subunit TctC